MKKYIFTLLISNAICAQSITLLKDINPGAQPSTPSNFAKYGGKLYFNANHVDYGQELWATDGSSDGTSIVSDINPGTTGSVPISLINYNNKLYFRTLAGTPGFYSYDDANGVSLVSTAMSSAQNFLVANDKFFFRNNNKLNYFYQNLITQVNTDAYISGNMGSINGKIVMAAKTDLNVNNYQLYVYNGSTVSLLKVINPSLSANPQNFYYSSAYNQLFFSAGSSTDGFELWKTDGTEEGTKQVKDVNAGSGSSFPENFKQIGNQLFFVANDGVNGKELWVTDGTGNGTKLVKDINPGSAASNPNNLTELNGKLYFLANDGSNEGKLWESDGTANGTKITLELKPGYTNFSSGAMEEYNGALYISAKLNVAAGQELYKIEFPVLSTIESDTRSVSVYPNPTSGELFFANLDKGSYDLYDSKGSLLQKDIAIKNASTKLNVPKGVYFLVMKTLTGIVKTTKIIVK